MEDYNLLIQLTKDRFKAFDKKGFPYCFSITAEYDDQTKQPFTVAKAHTGIAEFTDKIKIAVNQLKANRIKIVTYKGNKENANQIDDTTYLVLPEPATEKLKGSDILDRIEEMLTRQTTLAGIVEEKTAQFSDEKNKHDRDLISLRHQIEIDRKNDQIEKLKSDHEDQIKKLTSDFDELQLDYKEASESLAKFQEIYDDEQQMQSWGKKIGGVLKGVVAVVPGVVKWAESKPMLAGLPQAIMSGGELQGDMASAPETPTVDFSSPQFQKMQRILQFVQTLTDEETKMFIQIIEKIEADKSTLLTLIELVK